MSNTEAFLDAVRAGNLPGLRALLDENPEFVDARNDLGQGGVLLAKYHQVPDVVRLLVERGATLNIWEAAAIGDNDRLMELIDADDGALNRHSGDGFTPLGLAAFFQNETIVHNLLARGADVNVPANNEMGVAPLHSAVAGRHMGIVQALLGAGARVNVTQQLGFTPLHGAAHAGDVEIVRLLLQHGADRSARAENGQTPVDLAMAEGHSNVVRLFEFPAGQ